MNRFTAPAVGLFLLFGSHLLLAQGGRPGGGNPRPSNDTTIQDFKRAMAIQAAPDQISDFQSLTKETEDARRQAHDLQQLGDSASDSSNLYPQGTSLKFAVEQAQTDNQKFVKGFSNAQKALLKDFTKKLAKAESEVAKEAKTLDEALKRPKTDSKELAASAGRVEKALTDLQTQQRSLADEMGIPKS